MEVKTGRGVFFFARNRQQTECKNQLSQYARAQQVSRSSFSRFVLRDGRPWASIVTERAKIARMEFSLFLPPVFTIAPFRYSDGRHTQTEFCPALTFPFLWLVNTARLHDEMNSV